MEESSFGYLVKSALQSRFHPRLLTALYSYVLKTSMDKKVHCITSLGTIFLFFSPCPGSEISSSGGHQRCSSALPKSLCRGMKIVLTCNLKGDEHVVETVALSLIVKSKKEKKRISLRIFLLLVAFLVVSL